MAIPKLGPLKPSESVNDLFYLNNSNTGVDGNLRSLYSGNGLAVPIFLSDSQVQLNCNLGLITKPLMDAVRYKYYDIGTKTSAYALSTANSKFQKITLGSNITLTVVNDIETGNAFEMTLVVQQSTGGHSITFPGNFKPAGYSTLTFSATAAAINIFKISTIDGGTSWFIAQVGGGGSFSSPMTTEGDTLVYSGGASNRLPVGDEDQVLTVVSGVPTWADSASGFANPMTTNGDLIYQSAGSPARLAIGTNNYVLTVVGGVPTWSASVGFANPMTTNGDIIIQSGGVPTRLAKGTDGQFLWLASGLPAWRSLAASDIPSIAASKITSGQLVLAQGGTGADLSATGGSGQYLKQATTGATITVSTISHSELTSLTTGDPHTQYLITSPGSGSTRNILSPGLGNHKDVLVIQQSDSATYPGLGIDVWYFGVVKDTSVVAWMLFNNDGEFTRVQQSVDLEILANKNIKFFNSASTYSVSLKASSSLASDLSLTLPSANGSSGQFLQTNGSGGVLSWATLGGLSALSQITSDQNNYALGDTNYQGMYTVSCDANGRKITGIAGGSGGRIIRILNTGTKDLIFTNQDSASSSGNKIQMPFDLDMVLRPNDCWTLVYESGASCWYVSSGYEGYIEDPSFVTSQHDDFVYGTNGNGTFGELGWSLNNNVGTCAVTADETGYFGAAKISSGTLGSGRGELVSNNPVNISLPTGFILEATVRLPVQSATTNTTNAYTTIIGISNSMGTTGSSSSTQIIAFTYDRVGYGDHNWRAVTAGASATVTNTSVATSSSYQRLKIVYNTAGTQAKFYINESLVATNTTNFPSSGPYAIKFGMWNTSSNTTSMVLYVENYKIKILRTTRRS